MDKTDPKIAIVGLSKQTGFNQDSVILQIFFQTEQTVNRKKSGFRAAPIRGGH